VRPGRSEVLRRSRVLGRVRRPLRQQDPGCG
jgi:hypothetical protein